MVTEAAYKRAKSDFQEITMSADTFKRKAAERALTYVERGMKIGLGTGSTAAHFVDLLGAKVKAGLDVVCVPTSEATAVQARALGITLTTLDDITELDLTVDGADELDADLCLIKGGGGALLREKIVADASKRLIIIADRSKLVETLGAFPLPLEVVPYGLRTTMERVQFMAGGAECEGPVVQRMRADGKPFVTDNGNFILDCKFGAIGDPDTLDMLLKCVPGVVENGMFLHMADIAIVAGPDGVEVLEADDDDFGDIGEFDEIDEAEAARMVDEIFNPKKKKR
jgi:ribose 5-phosphate isomerase A